MAAAMSHQSRKRARDLRLSHTQGVEIVHLGCVLFFLFSSSSRPRSSPLPHLFRHPHRSLEPLGAPNLPLLIRANCTLHLGLSFLKTSMDSFIIHSRPPSIFSLFPDALAVVIRQHKFTNEALAILALVNREASHLVFVSLCNVHYAAST